MYPKFAGAHTLGRPLRSTLAAASTVFVSRNLGAEVPHQVISSSHSICLGTLLQIPLKPLPCPLFVVRTDSD